MDSRAFTRSPLFLFVLFAVALVIRLIYMIEFSKSPYFDQINPAFDHYNFDVGAMNFANGDWLADAPNNNYAPLYKYFLGTLYALFGRDFFAVYMIQFIMGSVASVIMYLIARDLFDWRAGVFAFLGFATFTTEIIYEGIVLRAAFIAFWGIVSFYLLMRLRAAPSLSALIWATLALSIFFQGRPNTLLCLPFVCFYLYKYVFPHWQGQAPAKAWVWFAGVLGLSFVPILVQCYIVHGKFVLFDASGPHTFISGNLTGYSGVGFNSDLTDRFQEEHGLSYGSTLGFLIKEVFVHPLDYTLLYLRKVFFFFNDNEAPSNISVYLYRQYASCLGWLNNHFAVISGLALAGLVLAIKRRKDIFLLTCFAFAMTFSVILFLNESRYRIPAAPFYILFASFALSEWVRYLREKNFRNAIVLLVTMSVSWFAFADIEGTERIRAVDYNNIAAVHANRGDFEIADRYLTRAYGMDRNQPIFYYNKGQFHFAKGEWKLALHFLDRVDDSARDNPVVENMVRTARYFIARDYMKRKKFQQALPHLKTLVKENSRSPKMWTFLAVTLFQLGQVEEGRQAVDKALSNDPTFAPALMLKSPGAG